MTEVEIGFGAVDCHKALAVLTRVKRARIDVQIRVKFLRKNGIAPIFVDTPT